MSRGDNKHGGLKQNSCRMVGNGVRSGCGALEKEA